jgi:hypothetical protein
VLQAIIFRPDANVAKNAGMILRYRCKGASRRFSLDLSPRPPAIEKLPGSFAA